MESIITGILGLLGGALALFLYTSKQAKIDKMKAQIEYEKFLKEREAAQNETTLAKSEYRGLWDRYRKLYKRDGE